MLAISAVRNFCQSLSGRDGLPVAPGLFDDKLTLIKGRKTENNLNHYPLGYFASSFQPIKFKVNENCLKYGIIKSNDFNILMILNLMIS